METLIYWGDIGADAKFQNRSINPSGRKLCGTEERKEKKNNHKNSGHFVLQPRQRAAHALRSDQYWTLSFAATPTGRARTPLGPKYKSEFL